MMKRIILIVTVLCLFQPLVIKADINIVFEDIICPVADENYYTNVDSYLSDDGKDALIVNFTLLQTLPSTCEGHFTLFGLSMGQYTMPSGVDFTLPICEMLAERIIMGPVLRVLGFNECPVLPGVYGSDGYVVPTENFPDQFLPNKYLAIFEILNDDQKLFVANIFLEVQ